MTPARALAVVYPIEGRTSTHVQSFVDRRAIRHVASGVSLNTGQVLLGLIMVAGAALTILSKVQDSSGDPNTTVMVGCGAIVIVGALLMLFARRGELAIFDETGTSIKIPLKASELFDGAEFAQELGASLGR